MARSKRQRKRARVVRQATAVRRRAVARERQVSELAMRSAVERLERMYDPATPVQELAGLLAEQYEGAPVLPGMVGLLLEKGSSAERLAAVASAMRSAEEPAHSKGAAGSGDVGAEETDAGDAGCLGREAEATPSLTVLTLAAQLAYLSGDRGRARELLDQALAIGNAADDPDTVLRVIAGLPSCGRLADALELTESRLRENPADRGAAERYASLIEQAHARSPAGVRSGASGSGASGSGASGSGASGSGPCECGSSAGWQQCCGPREQAAVDRFTSRTGLDELRDAVVRYLPGSGYARPVAAQVAEWLSYADADRWDDAERRELAALAAEHAWIAAGVASDDETVGTGTGTGTGNGSGSGSDADDDEDTDNVLSAFGADPAVPADLAARARTWREHVRYGLWQVADPAPSPGLWLTDIVTGASRYVALAPEQAEELPRWAVLLGAIFPVDGVWRLAGATMRLSPSEADAMAETAHAAVEALVYKLAGKASKRAVSRVRQPVPFAHTRPHGVLASAGQESGPGFGRLAGAVLGTMLYRLVSELHEWRGSPPQLTNSDGDPMCLVKARVAVPDATATAGRLAAHRDFERDRTDPARLAWLGRVIPEAQRATMLAELSAQMRAQGKRVPEIAASDGPQRWVRGQIRILGGELAVEVNSRERLARLLDLIRQLGDAPEVIEESSVDPRQDLAWPAGPRAFPRGAAAPEDGWEKHWLDEPVPALRGRTPREAAGSKDWAMLEALLRQFEYEGNLLAADRQSGVDTGWLRRELDMPADAE